MSVLINRQKLTVQTGTRIPNEWADEIDAVSRNRAEFIREAIHEKLIKCSESYYSQEITGDSMKTKFSSKTESKSNVIKVLFRFFGKQQMQKKTDGYRSFSAHSSQG